MYFSERRKQGLGSLRPGYFIGGPIGNLLMGNAMQWGMNKGIDYFTKSPEQREKEKMERDLRKFAHIYVPQGNERDDDDETNKTSGWKGALGGGLMNLLATAVLGPVMGPIALTVGRGLMNKNKGLGFTGGSGGSGPGPKPPGPQKDWYTGSDEEDKDIENQITKDFSGIDSGGWDPGVAVTTTSAPSHIGPTGQDIHGNGDSGSSSSDQGETSSDSGFSDSGGWADDGYWAEGGRVSYSQGGIASLWQR